MKAIVIRRRALAEIEAAARWWRENRPAAADLFDMQIEQALRAIAAAPEMGVRANLAEFKDAGPSSAREVPRLLPRRG